MRLWDYKFIQKWSQRYLWMPAIFFISFWRFVLIFLFIWLFLHSKHLQRSFWNIFGNGHFVWVRGSLISWSWVQSGHFKAIIVFIFIFLLFLGNKNWILMFRLFLCNRTLMRFYVSIWIMGLCGCSSKRIGCTWLRIFFAVNTLNPYIRDSHSCLQGLILGDNLL